MSLGGAFPVQGTRQPYGRMLVLPRDHVASCGSWACLLLSAVGPRTAQRSPTRWNSAGRARAPSKGCSTGPPLSSPLTLRCSLSSPARPDQNANMHDAPQETSPGVGLAGPSDGGTVEQVRSWRVGPGCGLVAPDPGDVSPSGVLGRRPGGQSDEENSARPSCPAVRPRLSCRRAACRRRSFDG
jgi:hypothetical protein